MSDKVLLTVDERTVLGKKVKQLRKDGLVPGVLYGQDIESQPIITTQIAAERVWRTAGKHHPIELTVAGKKRLAMIKSAELDPVKRNLRHLSLHVVRQNQPVEAEVVIKIAGEGETPAERAGLVVLQALETVTVEALPNDLPDFVQVAGEKLANAGDTATIADIVPIKGVTIMATDPTVVVASVYEPAALAAKNDAMAGEAAEPGDIEAENGSSTADQSETKDAKSS